MNAKKRNRMIGNKKAILSMAMAVLLLFSLVGCGETSVSVEDGKNTVVMTFGDYDVTLSEYNLYAIQYLTMQALDPSSITESQLETMRSDIESEIKLEIVEYLLAQTTEGVEVAEEDIEAIQTNTDKYIEQYGEDFFQQYGIDRAAVEQLFTEQAYISALVDKAKADMAYDAYDENVEKFEGITFHSVYYALFPSIEYDEDGNIVTDSSGNSVLLSDEQLKEQKSKAEELQKRAKAGESLEDLIEEYGIAAYSGEERNYSGAYTEELNKVVEGMKKGDISEVVETDAGYMVVRMDNPDDADYKDYALKSAAMQYANDTITTLQQNWVTASGYANVEADTDAVAKIDLKQLCEELKAKGIY